MAKKTGIGLDIGSSAVRAAEVEIDGKRRVLRRFGQVGLPPGAVVEGEVHDRDAVAAAIKRLWQHGGFSGRKVVVGLASQRTMVRQVEMPPMPDAEVRSALQLKIGEFLPIPVDQAVVDFAPLPGQEGTGGGRRVLLVAAQRDVVADELAAVEAAGLRVQAVDSSSLALLRAVAPVGPGGGGGGGLEAIIGIGAELVTVAVRDNGAPRFVRTVALTGPSGGPGETPRPGLSALAGTPGARTVSAPVVGAAQRLDAIVSEVRSSLEYLLSQSGTGQFEQVVVTGGGALLPGVTDALQAAVGLPVRLAECHLELDKKELALDGAALEEASSRWLTAVGLALWGTDSYGSTSLVPAEVYARRQQRRTLVMAGAAVVAVLMVLGGVSFTWVKSADTVESQIQATHTDAAALQVKIKGLGYVLQVPMEVQSRRALAIDALTGDIDWIGLIDRLHQALPADITPGSVTLTKSESTTVTPGSTTITPGTIIGTFGMTAETKGGAKAVAQFIDRLSHVNGLYALWVTSTTDTKGVTSITASAELTTGVLSSRAATVPGEVTK